MTTPAPHLTRDEIVRWVIVIIVLVVVLGSLCWTLDHVGGTFVDPLDGSSLSLGPGG